MTCVTLPCCYPERRRHPLASLRLEVFAVVEQLPHLHNQPLRRDPLYRGSCCDPKGSMAFLQNDFRCPPKLGARRIYRMDLKNAVQSGESRAGVDAGTRVSVSKGGGYRGASPIRKRPLS